MTGYLRTGLNLLGSMIATAAIMMASASVAYAAATFSDADEARGFAVCERATARWERISDVPNKLLHAISLAESGRWSKQQRQLKAWPWTVTSGGPGSYFATKEEALAEVRRLQAKGIENIDVGCMQVNLHYHGENFNNAAEAMDPDINVAYAAKFLTRLRQDAESWGEAAGYYHSMTPERTEYYRGKVEKFWSELTNGKPTETKLASLPKETGAEPEDEQKRVSILPIDRARTDALNKRFSSLKQAARKLRDELDPELRRQRQMEAWRTARGRAEQLQHLVAVRKAELDERRKQELKSAFKSDNANDFLANRKRQLNIWRERVASVVQPIN